MNFAHIDKKLFEDIPWSILVVNFLIICAGFLTLYSATRTMEPGVVFNAVFRAQLLWFGVGVGALIVVSLFDYKRLEPFIWPMYVILCVLLVLVLVHGRAILGAKRWIDLGFVTLQPSEPMKFVMLFALAKLYSQKDNPGGLGVRDLLLPAAMIAVPFGLILKQPDLGTGLLIAFESLLILIFVGLRLRILFSMAALLVSCAPILWMYALKDYQKGRILTFLDPSHDPLGRGYQIIQSMISTGSGQLWGKGYLQGTQNQLGFIPKPHTDFIFSVFAEEWGFVGCCVLLFLYVLFLGMGIGIAVKARDRLGSILAFGISGLFFVQVVVNVGMEVGLLPVVGVPLPFLSYGGSAMITNLACTGLLVNISMRKHIF